jgi:signal transduction histidine kinase
VPNSAIWRTTPFRLALQFGAAYVLGVAVLLGLVYARTAEYLTHRVDRILVAEAGQFRGATPEDILFRVQQESHRDPLNTLSLYSASGQRVAGDIDLPPPQFGLPSATGQAVREFSRLGDRPAVRALAQTLPWGETLVVARDMGQLVELRRILVEALALSGSFIAALGLASGFLLSLDPLRRIQAMRQASARIVAGDLGVRLPLSRQADELDALAAIVNTMMDEVERLVVHAQTAGESIAHELRTPLTRLRATLEHAGAALAEGDPIRDKLDVCVAEADSVLVRFRALLRIAAVEATRRTAGFAVLDLSNLIEQVAELYAPLAAERELAFDVDIAAGVSARVDSDLFVEAVANVLDNALKFTPPGGAVGLSLKRVDHGFVLEVSDTGPGIPEADRPMVVKRFYRNAVHHSVPGHGLGLSLVSAVARMHGLELSFADNTPTGARVRIAAVRAPI